MRIRKSLTPAAIDGLSSGRLVDPGTPGLFLVVKGGGKKVWTYRRRLHRSTTIVKMTLGAFPAFNIPDARKWAEGLNAQVEDGIDPRIVERNLNARANMTVEAAHVLYMTAVKEGRASRAKKLNRPRTIADKLAIYDSDVAFKLGRTVIYDVTEEALTRLVLSKGKGSKVRANRLATELKVFFGWASSLRGTEVGLPSNPALRLADLKFPETSRTRKFSLEEIGWFLRALALEPQNYQRGFLLLLLTAARRSEIIQARSDELHGEVWVIPENRSKNSRAHRVALGPWGLSLFQSKSDWIFPSRRAEGPQAPSGWYKARTRILKRMSDYAGRPIDAWTPHDMRRTARSNTKRLDVDFETAEAMLNHAKKGLERIYDGYELEDEKRAWFLKWEAEIEAIAKSLGLEGALGIPNKEFCAAGAVSSLPTHFRRHPTRGRGSPSRRGRR